MATQLKKVDEDPREKALQERIAAGFMLEDESEMTPRYRDVLVNTIHIAADLEVVTLPTYSPAIKTSPTLEDKIAIAAACQDELGHAQVMYRILEDFGYDTHGFLFERDPNEWRTFQMLEFPHEDYIESVISMCYGDRAGYITTVDLEDNCSYKPLARSLRLRTGRHYVLYITAIISGAIVTHSLVPPTPGPLLMADRLGLDLGVAIVGEVPVSGRRPGVSVS